ncbi:MAG: Transketolase [Candidatus Gottesmanbacteria bacterium GW2011_GWC2_42_8]|nr:MAG: Transketolase [Candidatus Gottesmanbacteria bacterium GW2011_GWC2_42_8]
MNTARLSALAKLVRYYSLVSSSSAGSGHPTSSLSAADLMTVLMFGRFYHFDFDKPENLANDRLIFSKGHASPLYYSLFLAANQITETEIKSLRRIDSPLEGHPTPRFKFTEVATGSLGQGLSIGFGMALAIRKYNENLPSIKSLPRVFVLLGDGEMAEGSVWEAVNLASYYKLNNLTAILDVNRLGQSRETMLEKRFKAFGWQTEVLDGLNLNQISQAFQKIQSSTVKQPTVIIAKTVKGKGVSFIENKEGWHGKPLAPEDLVKALKELGKVDLNLRGEVAKAAPAIKNKKNTTVQIPNTKYKTGDSAATRKAYGNALARLGEKYPLLVSLDGDVKNSTYAEIFQAKYPGRFFEMFIAEQNMVGALHFCRFPDPRFRPDPHGCCLGSKYQNMRLPCRRLNRRGRTVTNGFGGFGHVPGGQRLYRSLSCRCRFNREIGRRNDQLPVYQLSKDLPSGHFRYI